MSKDHNETTEGAFNQEPLFFGLEFGLPIVCPEYAYGEPTDFKVGPTLEWPCPCFRTSGAYNGTFYRGEKCDRLGSCPYFQKWYREDPLGVTSGKGWWQSNQEEGEEGEG